MLWYKLTWLQQGLFLFIVGFPVFALIITWIARCCFDGMSEWLGYSKWFDYGYERRKDKTYNVGNANNTGTFTNKADTPAKKKYYAVNEYGRDNSVSGLLQGERETPPRATFFGREGGKPLNSQSELEPEWLNSFELAHWERQQKQNDPNRAQDTENKGKTAQNRHFPDIEAQNIETAEKLGIIDRKKAKKLQNSSILGRTTVYWSVGERKWYLDTIIPVPRKHVLTSMWKGGVQTGEITTVMAELLRDRYEDEQDGLLQDKELDLTEAFAQGLGGCPLDQEEI
jgi:hypothetical protein